MRRRVVVPTWLARAANVVRPSTAVVPKKSPCPPGYKLDPRRDKCVPAGTGKKN